MFTHAEDARDAMAKADATAETMRADAAAMKAAADATKKMR